MRMDTPSNQQDQLLENSIQNDDHAIVDDDGEAHSHTAGQETSSVGAVIDLEPQLNVNNRSPALEMGQQMFVPDSEDAVAVAREEGTIVQVAKVDDAQVSNEMSADQIPTETHFEAVATEQHREDDSSSLTDLDLEDSILPSRDLTPEELQQDAPNEGQGCQSAVSSEDIAVIQDSQPVYCGKPLQSSSPIQEALSGKIAFAEAPGNVTVMSESQLPKSASPAYEAAIRQEGCDRSMEGSILNTQSSLEDALDTQVQKDASSLEMSGSDLLPSHVTVEPEIDDEDTCEISDSQTQAPTLESSIRSSAKECFDSAQARSLQREQQDLPDQSVRNCKDCISNTGADQQQGRETGPNQHQILTLDKSSGCPPQNLDTVSEDMQIDAGKAVDEEHLADQPRASQSEKCHPDAEVDSIEDDTNSADIGDNPENAAQRIEEVILLHDSIDQRDLPTLQGGNKERDVRLSASARDNLDDDSASSVSPESGLREKDAISGEAAEPLNESLETTLAEGALTSVDTGLRASNSIPLGTTVEVARNSEREYTDDMHSESSSQHTGGESAVLEDTLNEGSESRTTSRVAPEEQISVTTAISERDTPSKPTTSSVTERTVSTPSVIARPQATSTKGKTYVGGMLASNKAMRPFRSPMLIRKDSAASTASNSGSETAAQSMTPSKSSSAGVVKTTLHRKSLLSSSIGPPGTSASSPAAPYTRDKSANTATPGRPGPSRDPALNKPFKSLFSRQSATTVPDNTSNNNLVVEMVDIEGKPMSSFQLSTALPKLERRLALLKDAKRHRLAMEKGTDSADNTDHIRELSAKWLEKGREAAELLWELVKDNMEGQDANAHGDSGFGSGFDNSKNASNWGWDTSEESGRGTKARRRSYNNQNWYNTNTVELLREKVSMAIDELSEEDKQALFEQEGKEGSLPDLDPDMIIAKTSRKRAIAGAPDDKTKKRSRLEHQADSEDDDENMQRSQNGEDFQAEDNYAVSEHDLDEKEEEVSDSPEEAEDDPSKRGMAKMLISCGIDTKTFGWDAAKEEWNVPGGGTSAG